MEHDYIALGVRTICPARAQPLFLVGTEEQELRNRNSGAGNQEQNSMHSQRSLRGSVRDQSVICPGALPGSFSRTNTLMMGAQNSLQVPDRNSQDGPPPTC